MKLRYCTTIALVGLLQSQALAKGLEIEKSVEVGAVYSSLESDGEERDIDTYEVSPIISADYSSGKVDVRSRFEHQLLYRNFKGFDDEDVDDSRSYTNFSVNADISAIDNVLLLNLNTNQAYRTFDPRNAFVRDIYNSDDLLAKTQAHTAGFIFTVPGNEWITFYSSGGISKVESDRTTDGIPLENDNTYLNTTFASGSAFTRFRWNINSSYSDSQSETTRNNDSTFRSLNGSLYFGLYGGFSFMVTGRDESNTLRGNDTLSRELDFSSYGVGISWTGNASRNIELTYNRSEESDGEEKYYVGTTINWPFSARTRLRANYGRRFFGESGGLNFSHKGRRISANIGYTESITSYSRLVNTPSILGVFVCPQGAVSIGECFVPPDADYELGVGEEFIPIAALTPEITEQVNLRRSASASIGYDYRRLSTALSFTYSDNDYLETARKQRYKTVGFNSAVQVGVRSTLSFDASYGEIEESDEVRSDRNTTASLGLSYSHNSNLTSEVALTYQDRDSELQSRDLEDRRISLSMTYVFD